MSTIGVFHRIKKLGEGTYGSVYRATAIDSGHVIAFKRMVMTNDEEGVPATAMREIALLRELKHTNVVDLLHVLFEPPKITLVFELCDYDLKQYIESKNDTRLDLDTEVRPILKQMLTGLSYLHSKSVVHRDLKPQNVFLNIRPAYYALSDGSGTYPATTATTAQQLASLASAHALTSSTTTTATAPTSGSSVATAAPEATVLMTTCATAPPADAHASGGAAAALSLAPGVTAASLTPAALSCIIVKLGDFGLARVENIPVKKYSHEAVTLWYRSPDVIMGSALYGLAVDMWSVGAIFFEMVTGKVFLAGRNEEDQLLRIFRLLGSPTRETWPSMLTYPNTLERLQRVQTLVVEGTAAPASAATAAAATTTTTAAAAGGGGNRSANVISNDAGGTSGAVPRHGVVGASAGVTDHGGSSSSSSSSNSAAVAGAAKHEAAATTTAGATRANTYNLPSEVWMREGRFDEVMTTSGFRAAVGDSGVDLLRCCLQYEPQYRITAAQALRHPFLRNVQTHDVGAITQHMDALAQSLQYKGL